jgi:hypothetical protein
MLKPAGLAVPRPDDCLALSGFPNLGLWMLAPDGEIAHWLGQPFRSRRVLEPINVIILDREAKDEADATKRLELTMIRAGFRNRGTHSAGYMAYIVGEIRNQLHAKNRKAYSDASFIFSNDHGRVFGPVRCESGLVFTAALSRENADPLSMKHTLKSFNMARDRFVDALASTGIYRISGYLQLGNAVLSSAVYTTFDHDGIAVLLERDPPN